jgi:hypothetical protein
MSTDKSSGRKERMLNVDRVSIYRATSNAKDRIQRMRESLEGIDLDLEKKDRLEKCLCKHCFYLYQSRMGGAKMTNRDCGICHETQRYSSTATDPLCLPCAKINNLCKQCGGDIEMKHTRKLRDYES